MKNFLPFENYNPKLAFLKQEYSRYDMHNKQIHSSPMISVVIPTYNNSNYIGQAIESVFNQSLHDYEVIVVDDGSTDNTYAEIQRFGDRVRYLYQDNQGSAEARNRGIRASSGEFIAFLDADDYWIDNNKLAEQINQFEAEPFLGCISTGWYLVNQNNEKIKDFKPWHSVPLLELEDWLKHKCVKTSTMMIRRNWLEKVDGFDPELRQAQDVDLILRLSLAGCKSAWLQRITTCYRQHSCNTTKNAQEQARYIQLVIEKFFNHSDLPISIRQLEQETKYYTLVWTAWYQYQAGELSEMQQFLQKSLLYTPFLKTETILNWLKSFSEFSIEQGYQINIDHLTDLLDWQQLIQLP